MLSGDPGEDPQVHACKLLEVLLLQCQGRIDAVSDCRACIEHSTAIIVVYYIMEHESFKFEDWFK